MASTRLTPPPPIPKGSFYPPGETDTYRDLLMFENRLKSNAAFLNRRKSRYQLFLGQLLVIIIFLTIEVTFQTSLLTTPYKRLLRRILPNVYHPDVDVQLHPYFTSGLLTIAVTTLVLFFASGTYAEKIGYANRYVPHANRCLRNFNMYLNVRQRPLRSRINLNLFSLLLPSDANSHERASRTPSPDRDRDRASSRALRKRGVSVPIPPIPPSTNPRGEIIFSSRVDRSFRESYERHRARFERILEERDRLAAQKTWYGWRIWPWNWRWKRKDNVLETLDNRGGSPALGATPIQSRTASPARRAPRRGGAGRGGRSPSMTPPRSPIDRLRTDSFT